MLTGEVYNTYSSSYDSDGAFSIFYKIFDNYCYAQINAYNAPNNESYLTLGTFVGETRYTSMLALNDPINSSGSFLQYAEFVDIISGTLHGLWPNDNSIGYVGLTFPHDSNTYYGWVEFSVDPQGLGTIYGMGYNDTPGAGILAGQGVPEPADAAALAGILAGSAAAFGALSRRRRKMASAA
jgi:hypothetical protein